jgi:cytochrome c551/c552
MMTTSTSPADTPPAPAKAPVWRRIPRIALFSVIGLLLVAFIGIQLIPVNRANPPVTTTIKWDSPQTEALAKRACLDCHSNQTVWPWYSYVAPVSWVAYYDVVRGRRQLNFSTLGGSSQGGDGFGAQGTDLAYQWGAILAGDRRGGGRRPEGGGFPPPNGQRPPRNGGGEGGGGRFAETIQNGSMPPARYTQFRPDAILTDAERRQLIAGLAATFSGVAPQGN